MDTLDRHYLPHGTPVRYHGSRLDLHGEWTVNGLCVCGYCRRSYAVRFRLERADGLRIRHARRESFTPLSETGDAS